MKYFFIILLSIITPILKGQNKSFPIIISSPNNYKVVKETFKESQQWHRKVKYIGIAKDSILLSDNSNTVIEKNTIPFNLKKRLKNYNFECQDCIEIKVDTSQILNLAEIQRTQTKRLVVNYKSYPVIIKNSSDSLYKIGFGQNVGVIIEALDSDNIWKAIEIPYLYRCGNGLTDLYLHGNQIACVLIPIYNGDFKTQLRLRLNNHISNQFSGSINKKQFNKFKKAF